MGFVAEYAIFLQNIPVKELWKLAHILILSKLWTNV